MQKEGRTLVVGLGEVGGALAEVLERTGPILKHDLERREFSDPIEVMHLCLPFTRKEQFEEIALSYVERFKPALTIVNSTVLPERLEASRGCRGAVAIVRTWLMYEWLRLLRYRSPLPWRLDTASRAEEHFIRPEYKPAAWIGEPRIGEARRRPTRRPDRLRPGLNRHAARQSRLPRP